MKLEVEPLTPARWPDFVRLFGQRGCSVARGCACMYYRISGAPALPNGLNRAQMNWRMHKSLVDDGEVTGLIGYRDGVPVGWVSLGPRERFAKLQRSPVMKPVDEQPVWSIVCFVVPSPHRGQGVARAMLDAAIRYARGRGVRLLEAYPVDKPGRASDESMWFGTKRMYDDAGFEEVARRKPTRPIVRLRP
jgi:GNAT superfamily N-acetyltransferase